MRSGLLFVLALLAIQTSSLFLGAGCVDLSPPSGAATGGAGPRPDGGDARDADDAGEAGVPPATGAPGARCAHSGHCQSGFCVDAVCCDSACTSPCQSCNLPGSVGDCRFVPAGEDPRDSCAAAPAPSCMGDGACDGQGKCRLHVTGTECAPAGCTNATEQAASTCDGKGVCQQGASRVCSAGTCKEGAGSCGTLCGDDSACLTGFSCESGTCHPTRAAGSVCIRAGQCASGHCVDGVCCNSACAGVCSACDLAGTVGVCTAVPLGQNPDDECPVEPTTGCGRSGVCDGAGACQLHPAGTACGQASCVGSSETAPPACNGAGVCVAGGSRSCGAYACNGVVCGTSCSSSAQCSAGNSCSGTTCGGSVPDAGAPDAGGGTLIVDDFSDSDPRRNNLGGPVSWDNQTTSVVGSEQKLAWNGRGTLQAFVETLRGDGCEYDVSAYSKVRFRMRASVAGKRVAVHLGIGNTKCAFDYTNRITSITLSTTMTAYEVDITRTQRNTVLTVDFIPATLDATEYVLDDLVFLR